MDPRLLPMLVLSGSRGISAPRAPVFVTYTHRLVKQHSWHNRSHIGFNSRPFEGAGESLYVTIGDRVQYRNIRLVDGGWIKGANTLFDIAQASVPKTARVDFAVSPATDITVPVDPSWAGETITIDVRTFRADVENESDNFRTRTLTLNGDGEDATSILGTATLLDSEQRDGGIVRIRFRWEPAASGVQPDAFTAMRTAGPTSPANAVVTVEPGLRLLIEIDTPTLDDAMPYTYKIQASLLTVTLDVLTGITVNADDTGPVIPTDATAEAW